MTAKMHPGLHLIFKQKGFYEKVCVGMDASCLLLPYYTTTLACLLKQYSISKKNMKKILFSKVRKVLPLSCGTGFNCIIK